MSFVRNTIASSAGMSQGTIAVGRRGSCPGRKQELLAPRHECDVDRGVDPLVRDIAGRAPAPCSRPLNSSKITSSIREPCRRGRVATIVRTSTTVDLRADAKKALRLVQRVCVDAAERIFPYSDDRVMRARERVIDRERSRHPCVSSQTLGLFDDHIGHLRMPIRRAHRTLRAMTSARGCSIKSVIRSGRSSMRGHDERDPDDSHDGVRIFCNSIVFRARGGATINPRLSFSDRCNQETMRHRQIPRFPEDALVGYLGRRLSKAGRSLVVSATSPLIVST